jgi:hypothetical protein
MEETISVKRRVGEKLLMPIVAAGTSAAMGYVVKRAPGLVEDKVWPRVREAAQGAGGLSEKLPDKLPDQARSAVESGGEIAEQLVERARDITGIREDDGETAGSSRISQDELSRRSEERARHRAQRRKTTTSK